MRSAEPIDSPTFLNNIDIGAREFNVQKIQFFVNKRGKLPHLVGSSNRNFFSLRFELHLHADHLKDKQTKRNNF